jgi:hypothetical protein
MNEFLTAIEKHWVTCMLLFSGIRLLIEAYRGRE